MEKVGDRYRARKTINRRVVVGPLRDTWDEAFLDLASLAAPPDEPAPGVPTLRDFIGDQLEGLRARSIAYGTWKRDEMLWRTRIWSSDLGRTPIDKIDVDHCQAWINSLTHRLRFEHDRDEKGRAIGVVDDRGRKVWKGRLVEDGPLEASSRRRMGASLAVYFEIARKAPYRLIPANPMADVEYPTTRRVTAKRALNPDQARQLPASLLTFTNALHVQGPRFEAMVLTARDTGLRRGELCALTWDRLQRVGGVTYLVIDRARSLGPRGYVDGPTKTGSQREIPLSDETAARLRSLRNPASRSPYVFQTAAGGAVRPDAFTRQFRRFAQEVGVPNLTPHKLRHTYISLMLRAGVDVKTIQKLVGHSSHRMIMEIYAETFDESMRDATSKLSVILNASVLADESDSKSQA